MKEGLHHRTWREEKRGSFLKNDKRGAMIQFKAQDGGVIFVPEQRMECPPNTPVVVAFEVHQKIQDRVALVWSEEAFLELDRDDHEVVLEGMYQRKGTKKRKEEVIICDGVRSPHKVFHINGDVERKGTLLDGADVAFLPVVMNIREALSLRLA